MWGESSIAFPNTSPLRSPMPATMKIFALRVYAQLVEMAFHGFPRTAGSDSHLLVVVAEGPAGRKRISEPEVVIPGQAVRCVAGRPPGRGDRARSPTPLLPPWPSSSRTARMPLLEPTAGKTKLRRWGSYGQTVGNCLSGQERTAVSISLHPICTVSCN